jgi:N-acetylneuraminate synthase
MESDKILFVAEVSGNHNQDLERALKIVRNCAEIGVGAIKIQTYTADTITLNVNSPEFRISESHDLWGSDNLYDLYSRAHTPWDWHRPIFDLGIELGVPVFSTPFDETAVDFLEKLDCPIYKVASMEIVDLPLIGRIARTGKPMIISTGTATLGEISDAIEFAKQNGATDITLLICTSSYPADPSEANLARIKILRELFNVKVGLSDHTLGSAVSVAAAALGACVIEKHVTLKRNDGGVDAAFSMEIDELPQLLKDIESARIAVGSASNWRTKSESESVRLRPSLYFTTDVSPGDLVTENNVRSVRPSGGLAPIDILKIMGKRITKSAKLGDRTSWDYFEI